MITILFPVLDFQLNNLPINIIVMIETRDGNRIASNLFSKKNRIYISHRHSQKIASTLTKNRICNRISKLDKNNLRLFRFFNKLSTVLYTWLRVATVWS